MSNVLEDSLFVSQNKKFDEIQSIVRQFSAEYVGNSIIKDNIFAVIQNYARKKEIALEMLRYPIHDDELWALTFLKQDTIFVCVNTALPLCKQFFAAAQNKKCSSTNSSTRENTNRPSNTFFQSHLETKIASVSCGAFHTIRWLFVSLTACTAAYHFLVQ